MKGYTKRFSGYGSRDAVIPELVASVRRRTASFLRGLAGSKPATNDVLMRRCSDDQCQFLRAGLLGAMGLTFVTFASRSVAHSLLSQRRR